MSSLFDNSSVARLTQNSLKEMGKLGDAIKKIGSALDNWVDIGDEDDAYEDSFGDDYNEHKKYAEEKAETKSSGYSQETALFDQVRRQEKGSSLKTVTLSDSSSNLSSILMEDRKHDWLARQMREEERILRRGDMLDLGASHHKSCDSEMLKLYHLGECDADDIDNGEVY